MPPIDTFSQLPSIQRNLTGLSLQSGEPFAIQRTGQQLASNVAQSVPPYRLFGQALTELLKQYQQIGTAKFTGAELGARQEQARRVLGKTPQELIGASPQLQSQVRGVQAGALEPTISGARELKKTFTEQLTGLGGAIEQARALIKEGEESENKRRDDARTIIRDALTLAGGSAFQGADPKEVEQLEKMSGYPKGYIQNLSQTIRERELELKKQQKVASESSLDNWVTLLEGGQISLSQVPLGVRSQVVNRAAQLGIPIVSPTFAGKSKEAISAFNSATALLDTVESLSKNVITAQDPYQIPNQYFKGLTIARKFNPSVAVFQDTVQAFLSMLTRAAGERGVLTTQDVERIRKALPSLTDTKPIAEQKMQSLRTLFEGIRTGTIEAFTPSSGGKTIQKGNRRFEVIE